MSTRDLDEHEPALRATEPMPCDGTPLPAPRRLVDADRLLDELRARVVATRREVETYDGVAATLAVGRHTEIQTLIRLVESLAGEVQR